MIDALVGLLQVVAPSSAQEWVHAMRAEIVAIADPREARRFAMGCVWAAVIFRVRAIGAAHPRTERLDGLSAGALLRQVHAGCAAAAIGVDFLVIAKAPPSLIVVNIVATLLGVLIVAVALRGPGLSPRVATATTALIATTLLVTAGFGTTVDGASRWWQVGPMAIQTSLVGLPLAVMLFAYTTNRWTTAAMVAAAIAVALQPDRAMAAALCAGVVALLTVRRTRMVAIACAAAVVAVAVTWLQPDRLPAVPFVDHILWSGFQVHPVVGVLLWIGCVLLVVPMLASPGRRAHPASLVGGACWCAIVLSAAVGAYPTPVVGYGGAAILGYFLCVAALAADVATRRAPAAMDANGRADAAHSSDSVLRRRRHHGNGSHPARASHSSVVPCGPRITRIGAVVMYMIVCVGVADRASGQPPADECARPSVPKVETPGVWRAGPRGRDVALWPDSVRLLAPESGGRPETTGNGSPLVAGRFWHWATYVARPTMTIYEPTGASSGTAVLVLPGGGYAAVAIDLEGTEVCDWITAHGVTCVVLRYRVPSIWSRDARGLSHPPAVQLPLQDAQRAIGLLRSGAAAYGIDPQRIGVIGFSAGGHLAAAVSNAVERTYPVRDTADRVSSMPNFAILLYPGRLWDRRTRRPGLHVAPWVTITRAAPPTLLIHAMNDPVDDVRESAAYGLALHDVGVSVDIRLYAKGCHAFGVRPTADPITTAWPQDAVEWLRQRGMIVRPGGP